MTVSSTTTKISYSGNGSTVGFSVPFYFLADSHLLVILRSSAGVETVQTLGTDYSVSGAGVQTGGTVTMTVAPPSGSTLSISRNVPVTQTTDFQPNDRLPAETLEQSLDKLTMIAQQINDAEDRSIKIPETDLSSIITTLPTSANRANKYVKFDANGNVETTLMPPPETYAVVDEVQYATSGQTVFTLQNITYTPGINNLAVYVDGVNQYRDIAYNETNASTVTFTAGLHTGAEVKFSTVRTFASGVIDASSTVYQPLGSGAVQTNVQAKLQERMSLKDFGAAGDGIADDTAAINSAIAAANTLNKWLLWNEGTYRITSTITATLSEMKWIGDNAKIVADMGTDVNYGMNISVAENAIHQIVGNGIEFDGQGKCHIGVRFVQTIGSQTAEIYLEKVKVKNIEMQVGVLFGSSALQIRGGYKYVKLVDCAVENVMMRTGAGVIGSRGVNGIQIIQNGNPGAYSKHINLVRPVVNRVYSQDATYTYDMDGIGIFANPEVDISLGPSFLEIWGSNCTGCWGRDIKMQVASARVDAPMSLRNEGPSTGISNAAYAFQTGPAILTGGQFIVDNVACTDTGVVVQFSGGAATAPFSSKWIGGAVNIRNGGSLPYVAFCDTADATTAGYVASYSNVLVRGSITSFVWGRTNGFDAATIVLNGITCEDVTDALARVTTQGGGAAPYRAKVIAHDCINLGSSIPTVRCNVPGLGADAILDDRRGVGFDYDSVALNGTDQTFSGLQIADGAQMPTPLSQGLSSGSQKMYSFSLNSGSSLTLPSHGYNSNYIAEIIMSTDRTAYALLTADASGIVTISAGAGANIGTTADPGSGDLRIWRSTGTNQLVIKNGNASARVCLVRLFG
jgi:hypothetical protein